MKKKKILIYFILGGLTKLLFLGGVQAFMLSFEGNDQVSFINEVNTIPHINIVWSIAESNLFKFDNNSAWDLGAWYRDPTDQTSINPINHTGYAGIFNQLSEPVLRGGSTYNPYPLIDWDYGSLAFQGIYDANVTNSPVMIYFPTFANSFSSDWTTAETLVGSYGLRFFSNTTRYGSFDTGYLDTYGFKRATLIMNLGIDNIEYHTWNSGAYLYSNKVVSLYSPFTIATTNYMPGIGNSQPYYTCGELDYGCFDWSLLYFGTYGVFDTVTQSIPSRFEDVMIINVNEGGTKFSTFSSKSLLLRKGVDTGHVDYTLLDCASPDEFIFDSFICPVLSYGYLSMTNDGSQPEVFNDTSGPFQGISQNYSIVVTDTYIGRNYNGTPDFKAYFISTGSEQIIEQLVITEAGSSVDVDGIIIGGGVGILPGNQTGFTIYLTGISTGVTIESVASGGLKFFYCPYTGQFVEFELFSIPGFSILPDSWNYDLFSPVSCLYYSYLNGAMQFDRSTIPSLGTGGYFIDAGSGIDFGLTNPSSDGGRNLFVTIMNILLVLPALILFYKFMK